MTAMSDFQPFTQKLTPPTTDPSDGAMYAVIFNSDWLPIVQGALFLLWDNAVWEGTEAEILEAQIKASQLFNLGTGGTMRIGTVSMWVGQAVPDGCLLCDGAEYDKSAYPALWAVLGETFEASVDTFYVPNLLDRFPLGAGNDYGLNETGGEANVELTTGNLPAHTHDIGAHTHDIEVHAHQIWVSNDRVVVQSGAGQAVGTEPVQDATGDTPLTTNSSSGSSGSSGENFAHNNIPPYSTVYFIIQAT